MGYLMSEIVQQITELEVIKIDPPILEILFFHILLFMNTNYMLIRC